MDYITHLLILICIYLILAQGLNLNFGLGGMFNLAHVAAYAIGAYSTALLSVEYEFSFIACLFFSALNAAIMSLLLGLISLRLTLDYFAIGTLAFSFVISALLINWKSLTYGVLGVSGIPRPEIFNFAFENNYHFLALVFVIMFLLQTILYILFFSPYARTLKAQSEFIFAAQALGKHTTRARVFSFVIASAVAGIAGAFFAYYFNYIDPSSFSLHEMIFVFSIIIIGKPGSFFGNILACIFLVLLPEPLRFLDLPASILGPMRQFLYALVLFVVVYINRGKMFPIQRKV